MIAVPSLQALNPQERKDFFENAVWWARAKKIALLATVVIAGTALNIVFYSTCSASSLLLTMLVIPFIPILLDPLEARFEEAVDKARHWTGVMDKCQRGVSKIEAMRLQALEEVRDDASLLHKKVWAAYLTHVRFHPHDARELEAFAMPPSEFLKTSSIDAIRRRVFGS